MTRIDEKALAKVKALEWRSPSNGRDTLVKCETIVGVYRVWTHFDADGCWFWSLREGVDEQKIEGEARTNDEAKAAAQADYERRILSALEPAPAEAEGWRLLETRTFAVQHNPNCPKPWLVRLPGKSGVLDLKPYGGVLGRVPNETGDILGFGKTLDEAARAATAGFFPPAPAGKE